MYKTKIAITVGTAFLLAAASASYAADTTAQQKPLDQALESIDKNLLKNPGNTGLLNAREHLLANQLRHDSRDEKHTGNDELTEKAERHEGAERHERAEHHERAERPDRVERPDIASVHSEIAAARPELAGRPGH